MTAPEGDRDFARWFARLCDEDANPAGLQKAEALCRSAFQAGYAAALRASAPAGEEYPQEVRFAVAPMECQHCAAARERRVHLGLRLGQLLGREYDGVPLEDIVRELVQLKARQPQEPT